MMNKRGIELSVTLLVTLIIAAAMFTLGLLVVFRLGAVGDEVSGQISSDTERTIKQMLSIRGDRVAIPYSSLQIERGKAAIIVVGLQNVLESTEFNAAVYISKTTGYYPKGATEPEDCEDNCLRIARATEVNRDNEVFIQRVTPAQNDGVLTIEEDGQYVFSFPVSANRARAGTYYVNVDIGYECGNTDYCEYTPTQLVKVMVN